MAHQVLCPGCSTELDPTNTNCPVCLRTRTRKEILAGLAPTRKAAPRPWGKILLVVAAIGGGAYFWSTLPKPPPPPPPQQAQEAAAPQTAAPQAVAEAPQASTTRPASTTAADMDQPSPAPSATTPAAPPWEAPRSAQKQAPRRDEWAVTGLAYDLFSTKPVAGAKIVFQERVTGQTRTAVSNAQGRYQVSLPKVEEGGYDITVSKKGYTGAFLEEMSPPYRNQSAERRREAADMMTESALLHVPLLPEHYATEVTYDLVLFPR